MQVQLAFITFIALQITTAPFFLNVKATSVSQSLPSYETVSPYGHAHTEWNSLYAIPEERVPTESLPSSAQSVVSDHRIVNPTHLSDYLNSLAFAENPERYEHTSFAPNRSSSTKTSENRQPTPSDEAFPSPTAGDRMSAISHRDCEKTQSTATPIRQHQADLETSVSPIARYDIARDQIALIHRYVQAYLPDVQAQPLDNLEHASEEERKLNDRQQLLYYLQNLKQRNIGSMRLKFEDLRRIKTLYEEFQNDFDLSGPDLPCLLDLFQPVVRAPNRRSNMRRPRYHPEA